MFKFHILRFENALKTNRNIYSGDILLKTPRSVQGMNKGLTKFAYSEKPFILYKNFVLFYDGRKIPDFYRVFAT